MRVITIGYADNIECVMVVNDDELEATVEKLNQANNSMLDADKCVIKTHDPDSLEDAIYYIKTP